MQGRVHGNQSLIHKQITKLPQNLTHMNVHFLSAIFTILMLSGSYAQDQDLFIGFYNVENLFDTINQSNEDDEFLPQAESQWNTEKYLKKLRMLNQTIDSMGTPVLMGFCEVENKTVLSDLFAQSSQRSNYQIVHFESTDARGIDVALAYHPDYATLQDAGFIRFQLDNENHSATRDILWSKFLVGKDTVFAIVNHWPSRRGGQVESEPNRIKAAAHAAEFIDSVQRSTPKSKIIFMGDLNDYPDNLAPKLIAERLVPQITKASGKFGGSYNYRGEWDVLDHILISKNFYKGKTISVVKQSGLICSYDFLLTEYQGQTVPKRNYAGSKYLDGYSDHLPVLVRIKMK